jgi:hypothetical protein
VSKFCGTAQFPWSRPGRLLPLDALLVILELSEMQRAYVRGEQDWDAVARPEWALRSDR